MVETRSKPNNVLFWDFDGTLAHRPGQWTAVLASLLAEHDPACGISDDDIRPAMRRGFPWHTPEIDHPELCVPDAWWASLQTVLAQAYVAAGVSEATAVMLASKARERYLTAEGWVVFDDVAPTLTALKDSGWRHIVLSNHVPELGLLVEALGLAPHFDAVITSAAEGYEKPHPNLFRLALERAGAPDVAWMIGDNIVADVLGAEDAGLRGILVRNRDERARLQFPDLSGLAEFLAGGSPGNLVAHIGQGL